MVHVTLTTPIPDGLSSQG